MKKQFIFMFFLIWGIIFYSCNKDQVSNDTDLSAEENASYALPLSEALGNAQKFFEQLEGTTSRSKTRQPKNVEIVVNSRSLARSADGTPKTDTTLYLVNYGENDGFALLAADRRLCPVFAIGSEGALNFRDTIENKGLAMFLQDVNAGIQYFLENESSKVISRASIQEVDGTIKYPAPIIEAGLQYKYGPYGLKRQWSQESPFNKYCPGNAAVGCAAVAMGLIMAHHQYPAKINGYTLNWTGIDLIGNGNGGTETAKEQLAHLLRELGNPEYLNMNYGIESGASPTKVAPTFRKLGYTCGELETYNVDKLWSHFKSNPIPVYMVGYASAGGGHGWIINGMMNIRIVFSLAPGRRDETTLYYVHKNWGWRGTANGWYQAKPFKGSPYFDTTEGPELVEWGTGKTQGGRNYDTNLQMILEIKR